MKKTRFKIELGETWESAQGLYVVGCLPLFGGILQCRERVRERMKGNIVANEPHSCRREVCLEPRSPAAEYQKIYKAVGRKILTQSIRKPCRNLS